jgi:hypothetical protein
MHRRLPDCQDHAAFLTGYAVSRARQAHQHGAGVIFAALVLLRARQNLDVLDAGMQVFRNPRARRLANL